MNKQRAEKVIRYLSEREGQAVTPAELSLALFGDANKAVTAWVWAARDAIKRAQADGPFWGLRLESVNLQGCVLSCGEKLAAYRMVRGAAVCYRHAAKAATNKAHRQPDVLAPDAPEAPEPGVADFGLFQLEPAARDGSAKIRERNIVLTADEVEFLMVLHRAEGEICPLSEFRWPSDQLRKVVHGLGEKLDADMPFLSRVYEPCIVTPRGFRLSLHGLRRRQSGADYGRRRHDRGAVCAAMPG